MHTDGEPDHLDETDRIDALLRQSLAIADIIAETKPSTLEPATITTLAASLRSNLRVLTDLFRHTPHSKEQRQ